MLESRQFQNVVVLGLPRGGVPVAAEVAEALSAPLDVIIVRKIGVPWQPELALGSVGEDDVLVLNTDVVERADLPQSQLDTIIDRERRLVDETAMRYRANHPRRPLESRTALVVDDGIATGATARAACQVARAHGASRVVLAVPVAPSGWEKSFGAVADACQAVVTPHHFTAVGAHYDDFSQTTDDEVESCLERQSPRSSN
jgi:putative phosphoribosyl transferase